MCLKALIGELRMKACVDGYKEGRRKCEAALKRDHDAVRYAKCIRLCNFMRQKCTNAIYGYPPGFTAPPHVGKGKWGRFKDRGMVPG
jgi:hypothetical protein